jgi:pimeloyl-ACP methyl ester carboxylesterase
MFTNNLFYFLKIWLIFELINWFTYILIYVNIINPKFVEFKEVDTYNIIDRIDKLTKDEIEYVIGGCVTYDKNLHNDVDINTLQIADLSRLEMINLIGYSLFGLNTQDIYSNTKFNIIIKLIEKIELKLGYNFKLSNDDRYLYRKWGNNFIKFSFRPLVLQIPLKIFIQSIHILFTRYMGFRWEQINKIGFLTKIDDPNKQNIFFIHGLGFGYIPYFQTLIELSKKYNMIIVVLPNISSYNYYDDIFNCTYFPPLSSISNTIYDYLDKKNISDVTLIAHSFGTYITQILRKDNRSIIFKKIILVDPIIFWIGCFKMSLHVENPFIKKYPISTYLIDNLLSFMIYQCLYLKYVCFRVMFGPDFWIYDASELANSNIVIILEKADYIIPAELLYNKIKNVVKCYYYDSSEMYHGSILMEKKYIGDLINIIDK